jgi:hypothetical protein
MKGCNSCKHYKSEIVDFVDGKFQSKQQCLMGHNTEMLKWWSDNGEKTSENLDEMNCHEYPDIHNKIEEVLERMEDLIKKLKLDQ